MTTLSFIDAIRIAETYRKEENLTTKDMADLFGISASTYYSWTLSAANNKTVDSAAVDLLIEWATDWAAEQKQQEMPNPETEPAEETGSSIPWNRVEGDSEPSEETSMPDPDDEEGQEEDQSEELLRELLEEEEESPYFEPISIREFQRQGGLCDLTTYPHRRTLLASVMEVLYEDVSDEDVDDLLIALQTGHSELRVSFYGVAFLLKVPLGMTILQNFQPGQSFGLFLDHFLLTWLDLVNFDNVEEEEGFPGNTDFTGQGEPVPPKPSWQNRSSAGRFR